MEMGKGPSLSLTRSLLLPPHFEFFQDFSTVHHRAHRHTLRTVASSWLPSIGTEKLQLVFLCQRKRRFFASHLTGFSCLLRVAQVSELKTKVQLNPNLCRESSVRTLPSVCCFFLLSMTSSFRAFWSLLLQNILLRCVSKFKWLTFSAASRLCISVARGEFWKNSIFQSNWNPFQAEQEWVLILFDFLPKTRSSTTLKSCF